MDMDYIQEDKLDDKGRLVSTCFYNKHCDSDGYRYEYDRGNEPNYITYKYNDDGNCVEIVRMWCRRFKLHRDGGPARIITTMEYYSDDALL